MLSSEAAIPTPRLRLGLADPALAARFALFALGAAIIWAAPRPQMVDLPQHAAQVALLRDLLLGRSPWAGEIRINLATPYLIGYGLALPLAFVMSAGAALKTVLTVAYAGFILACVGVGRELGASRKLDAYYAVSFFGYAYGWGMYTFLVAAPVGLAFVWLCIRYARQGSWRQGTGVAALGLVLLFSHGLVFLFACGIGGLILAVRAGSIGRLIRRSWPFWIPLVACALLFVVTRERESAATQDFAAKIDFGSGLGHFVTLIMSPFDGPYSHWAAVCFAVFAGLPLLAGFRPDRRAREAVVIAACAVGTIAFAPYYAWSTSLVFERFAVFLPPAYAWLLRERPPGEGSFAMRLQPRLALIAGLAAAATLARHAELSLEFGREQRDFETVLSAAAPGGRALSLMFDPSSEVDGHNLAYMHFPLWYQADRGGFVDFNFAAFPPQVARFRSGAPHVGEDVARDPASFDWGADRGERYRYVFVRSDGPPPAFAGARCPLALVAGAGKWRLYERRACAAP